MRVATGTHLGPYEVLSALGAGGMGEVYRARDTKLGRDVAIKVLPDSLATDVDRRARFQREAHLLASLNHPHIAAIYGIEDSGSVHALVLELVEGETLAERIAKGPLPVGDALRIATQIADALDAAHDQGIIHRDLKPANIKITPAGVVKVLDFGLAKLADPAGHNSPAPSLSLSPTVTSPSLVTGIDVLLGTAAYMSPEQAKRLAVDKRADIWGFGVVVYEMLTGRRGFDGGTTVEVLSNVLKADPEWTALPPETPPAVRSLLRRCLQKDPRRRLRDIGDARFQIEEALTEPVGAASVILSPRAGRTRERLWWVAALVVATAAGGAGASWYLGRPQGAADEVRFEMSMPPTADPASFAISKDGRHLAFAATSDGQSRLWIRSLDSVVARPIAGTENATFPFWSPDSSSIGFFANGQVKRTDIAGRSVQELGSAAPLGGAWNDEGAILFSRGPGSGLWRLFADGREPIPVTTVTMEANVHRFPQFLPDGRHFLFHAAGVAPGLYVGELGAPNGARRIVEAQAGQYSPSGHLLFVRQRTLFAQPFDPARLELFGEPAAVAEQIVVNAEGGLAALSVAGGRIVYRAGAESLQSRFVWFDRSGRALETVEGSDVGSGFNSSLSPDGRHLAFSRNTGTSSSDLWLLELARGVPRRFTFDPGFDLTPVFSPDGRRIAFSSNRKGTFDPYVKPVAGRPGDEALLDTDTEAGPPSDWSPDGRFILRARQRKGVNDDIWASPTSADGRAFPVVETTFSESNGQFSPDGDWIAYQSDESGQLEIYVQSFAVPGQKTLISSGGGVQARWRGDGKELFYLAPDNRLFAVPIRIDAEGVNVDEGVGLFTPQVAGSPRTNYARNYMVSRDGQRFLVDTFGEVTLPVTVILNWNAKP